MEDVQHLLASGREESYLFLVDSRARDTAVHPSPSEYSITFDAPFRNVVGMDLLDATVARTEFIVDSATRVLEYALGQPPSLEAWAQGAWARGRKRTVVLDPGDYNLPQFLEHLNARLAAVAAEAGEAALSCVPLTNPSEVSNRAVLTCPEPFVLLAGSSTLRHTLGFGDPVTTANATEYAAVPGWTVNRTAGASDAFLSRPTTELPGAETAAALVGPVPAASLTQLEPVFGAAVLRQRFVAAADGPPAAAPVYATAVGAGGELAVTVRRASDGAVLAQGSLALPAGDRDDAYVPQTVSLTASGVVRAGEAYYLEFAAAGGGGSADDHVGVYYNEDNLPVAGTGRYVELDGQVVHPGDNLCCDLAVGGWGHALVTPGVVDLSGPRYVNIRCPEIESHMFRDRANERCHAGMGMVKLRGYGFREQRFDFVSFPPRRFHPIGRLSRLTFRLERPDGTPYDSHGVDHTLLLVLRYYTAPDTGMQAFASTLNPDYDPDARRYASKRHLAAQARAPDRMDARYGP